MTSLATTVLQMALALLLSVQSNTAATAAQRQQAITVANQAIQLATQALAGRGAIPAAPKDVSSSAAPSVKIPVLPVAIADSLNPAFSNPSVAAGASGAKIGSYALATSSSTAVTVTSLQIQIGMSANYLRNLVLKVGSDQVGSAQSTVLGGSFYTFTGSVAIPAGGTKILDVYADILESAGGNMSSATMLNSCAGTTATDQTISCAPITGQNVTVTKATSTFLSASLNTGLSNQSALAGAVGARIGSYTLTASSTSAISMSDVTVQLGAHAENLQNLKLQVNGSQIGQTQRIVFPNTPYSFPDLSTIAAGGTQTVDVYADVLATATSSMSPATTLIDCAGTIARIWTGVSCNSVPGQSLTITPPVAAFSAALNSNLGNQTVAASSTSVRIGAYTLVASVASAINLASVAIQVGTNGSNLQNLRLTANGSQVGLVQQTVFGGATYTFSGLVIIPGGGSQAVDVLADIPATAATGAISPATTLTGCTGTVVQNGGSVSCGSIPGQTLTIR
ncbi:MAG: hypothetical protein HY978_04165 [Candidatus Liptonbacteria bacterium]|nr:hypothetical protein [Candidatus Liptonbacteria bacterium]